MRSLVARPGAWLLLQAAVLLAYLVGTDQFSVQRLPDSGGYEYFPAHSLREALSQSRTVAYPLFLSAVRVPSPSLDLLPTLQLMGHALAVYLVYRGLCQTGVAPWTALVVASPLLYARTVVQFGAAVLSDLPALSLAVATSGLLLTVLARPRSWPAWVGLTLALFLTYQTRPAYLFMVGLVPLLGWLLPRVTGAPADGLTRRGVAAGVAAAALLPLLAFCALRWAVVGHFGLVSFGGCNTIGIAGQFLREADVESLPPDLRPLSRAMLEARAEEEAQGRWKRAVAPGAIDYTLMCESYNSTCQMCFGGAILALYHGESDLVLYNGLATRLAWALIVRHVGDYRRWLQRAFWEGCTMMAESAADKWVFVRLFALLGLLHAARRLRHPVAAAPAPGGDARVALGVMALLGVSFALTTLLLVIAVEVPLARYLDAAAAFLPSVVAAAVCLRCAP